jgi:hypothetical protein
MLKRIATIFAGSVAHGAGGIIGVRVGHDAYNWVKDGGAKRTVKRMAGTMADAASAVLPRKEEPVLRSISGKSSPLEGEEIGVRAASQRVSVAELGEVDCERCGRASPVQLGGGDVVVTCAKCKARFWVDTDELARRQ